MIQILREFNREHCLTEPLIQVASSESKERRVIEVLGVVADKEDGKALSFLRSLEDNGDVGQQEEQ